MNARWISPDQKRRQRRNRRLLFIGIVACLVIVSAAFFVVRHDETAEPLLAEAETVAELSAPPPVAEVAPAPVVPDNIVTRDIQSGDNLSAIFDSIPVAQPILHQVLAADESLLALDVLHPGNRLTFTLDETTRELVAMELFIHPGRQVVYRKVDDKTFEYEEIVNPGIWDQQLITGEINGSFYLSAMKSGLSEQETANVADLFRSKVDFARDMRAGDRFQVVRKQQFVDGQFTGQSLIEGVRIYNQDQVYTGFLFEDGNYYDLKGESLASAFRRYPFAGNYRITSSFNPRRKHPITGRISPHNGVDFGMSTGTPVLATGDGVVTRVVNHPYAGKYIEIQHSGQYVTRYLHLSRSLVHRGQKVKRGQQIAKSGNTGRSTGPHLHFELRVSGRPVNPIKAKIPMAAAIPKAKRQIFDEQVATVLGLMETTEVHQIAKSEVATDSTL